MISAARKITWFLYFSITLLLPAMAGAIIFENPSLIFLGLALAASLTLATYLSVFSSRSTRRRCAWLSAIAAGAAYFAARVIAFDEYCRQKAFDFCGEIEPPFWEWPGRILHADGHFGEDIANFQMWLIYFLAITIPLAIIAVLLTGKPRADF